MPSLRSAGRCHSASRRIESSERSRVRPWHLGRPAAVSIAGGVLAAVLVSVVPAGAASPDLCVAANGEVRVQQGTSTCEANGQGSVARAMGTSSFAATINGDHNRATASGDGSSAIAGNGDSNTATVRGDGSRAEAAYGDNNTATVSGDGSTAFAGHGDDHTATAAHDACLVVAIGDNQTDSC
jgi:hypothetical protein